MRTSEMYTYYRPILVAFFPYTCSTIHTGQASSFGGCIAEMDPEKCTHDLLEKAVKERKTHRNAHDFDGKFIKDAMNSASVFNV